MQIKRKKGFFSISAVAKMFSVHQQTVRLYEKEGLIAPKRSAGGTRLFSEEDVDRLEEVIYLTHQLGINLAGVEMILKLKKQMTKMQKDMNKLFDTSKKELELEEEASKQAVSAHAKQLMNLKKNKSGIAQIASQESHKDTYPKYEESEESVFGQWEIEYEE